MMRIIYTTLLVSLVNCYYDIDDSILYKIDFQPFSKSEPLSSSSSDSASSSSDSPGPGDADTQSPPSLSPSTETVTVTSVDQESFQCQIPRVEPRKKLDVSDYAGPSALGLLESIFVQSSCAYRAEPYWTYELCHGKYLRQYHEEREGKNVKLQEYYLGKFTKVMFENLADEHEKDKANGITRHPPTKSIEKIEMPYHEILMTEGTLCDLTGLPRKTRVLYTCYPSGRNEIYSFKEVSTCEYEVVVLTSTLCQHPSYRAEESKENLITCRPATQEQPQKPAKLSRLEVDSLKLRTESVLEAVWSAGDKPGQVKIEIRPVKPTDPDKDEASEPVMSEKELVEKTVKKIKESSQWKTTNRQPFKPLMDPGVVKQFLKGEYCLYGGTGWWKYEFCYGKKVDQFHEEGAGRKTVINLGNFNLEDHLAWLQQHPSKRPKDGDMRKQVSVFYSGGDICDLTGKPRQIEVKLKCKTADSPSTVTLYLLEPRTCEYVLGVESPLVCDLLPHADPATGLFDVELVDNLGQNKNNEQIEIIEVEVPKTTTNKVTKQTSYRSSSVKKSDGSASTTVVEETVDEVDGVKTRTKKVIVDGVVTSEETFHEKDGVVVEHSEVFKEIIDGEVEYEDAGDTDEDVDVDEDDYEEEEEEVNGKDEL